MKKTLGYLLISVILIIPNYFVYLAYGIWPIIAYWAFVGLLFGIGSIAVKLIGN